MGDAFPSGRAAILECLRLAGVGAETIVATPESVTGCVAASVRRRARPVALRAALAAYGGEVGAAIVYEQWGWPLPADAEDSVRARLDGVPVLVDRVDSADFFHARRGYGDFEVVSLSKVLGLAAGGLARASRAAGFVPFRPPVSLRTPPRVLDHPAVRELFKQSDHVHPEVGSWFEDNCVVAGVEAERRARQASAISVLDSQLARGWPLWMRTALEDGAAPVWVPVLRGSHPATQWNVVAALARGWNVSAAVKAFNWSGNPLLPVYESAVALPVHGGVSGVADIVASVEQMLPADSARGGQVTLKGREH